MPAFSLAALPLIAALVLSFVSFKTLRAWIERK
jgi:hypothetical protein